MNRRGFIQTLVATLVGTTLDPERLLWMSGEKTIFLPSKRIVRAPVDFARGDLFTIEGIHSVHPITHQSMTRLQHFVITADVRAGDSIEDAWWPPPIDSGMYQNVNRQPFISDQVIPIQPSFVISGQKMTRAERTAELTR